MTTPLLGNILNQPEALRSVSAWQFGEGRAALQQAAAFLKSKPKIILSGMGASLSACLPLQYQLIASGFDAIFAETAELLYFQQQLLRKDTALLLISRSGESIEVVKLLDLLLSRGIPVLGVVNVPGSTLAQQANLTVDLHSPPDQLVAIQTYTSTLAVFSLIHAAMLGELEQAQDDLAKTIEMLEDLIPQWVKLRAELHPFLEGNSPLYFVGRGPSLSAVHEGVLLMHETAKFPAVGMSVPQFRHGPLEVVDAAFRAVVIGTQQQTADLDAALTNDIRAMGGQAYWMCGCLAPERFASILDTVPLQILAYTKAELRGLRPGDFRWSTAVTSSESGFCPQT